MDGTKTNYDTIELSLTKRYDPGLNKYNQNKLILNSSKH